MIKNVLNYDYSTQCISQNPFLINLIAVGTAENFGIAGKGKVQISDSTLDANNHIIDCIDSSSQILDVKFSEANKDLILFASSTSINLYHLKSKNQILRQQLEGRKVTCCNWNPTLRHLFYACNESGSTQLYDVTKNSCVATIPTSSSTIYDISIDNTNPTIFCSVGADSIVRLVDLRTNKIIMARKCAITGDTLTCDQNKQDSNQIITGGVDCLVKIFDLRKFDTYSDYYNIDQLGHDYAIRKARWSPHDRHFLASASYDMSVMGFKFDNLDLKRVLHFKNNREFNFGLDFSSHLREFAVASWDKTVTLYGQ